MAERIIWITPSAVTGPQRSYERVTASLGGSADVTLKALEVWDLQPDLPYDLQIEVEGVARLASGLQMERFHLFGFSAGATVALAAALSLGQTVQSVAVFEPATIGDDDWAPVEAEWRRKMASVCQVLPPEARPLAFAQTMLPEGASLPADRSSSAPWTARTDLLEGMLAHVGFTSDALAAISAPALVITGGRSHPRFAHLASRLMTVMQIGYRADFPTCSHLSPPMRDEPDHFARLLRELWEPG
ncbi:MAG TPA: alpha/beta fold hydrolase [Candidatus Nanopelagicales bacterium]